MIEIVCHSAVLERSVIDLILEIQHAEFHLDTDAAAQPDLLNVANYYQTGIGNFWVALSGDEVVGTLGLRDIGGSQGALRRLYVKESYRGQKYAVAQQLLAYLVQSATAANVQDIYLATTDDFAAAIRFYEKNAFVSIDPMQIPAAFPRIPQETRFSHRALMSIEP